MVIILSVYIYFIGYFIGYFVSLNNNIEVQTDSNIDVRNEQILFILDKYNEQQKLLEEYQNKFGELYGDETGE